MKKVNIKLLMMLLGIVALSIIFTACGDDDDPITKAGIIGKWRIEKVILNGKTILAEYECTNKNYLEFKESGTLKNVWYDDDDCKEHIDLEKWNLTGNTLTTEEKEGENTYTYIFTVKELTKDNLILEPVKSLTNGKEDTDEEENNAKTLII